MSHHSALPPPVKLFLLVASTLYFYVFLKEKRNQYQPNLAEADMYHQHNRIKVRVNQRARRPNAFLLHQTLLLLLLIRDGERQHSTDDHRLHVVARAS